MPVSTTNALMLSLAAFLVVGFAHRADARTKHHTAAHRVHPASSSAEAAFWGGLSDNGTPVIMRGFHPSKAVPEDIESTYRRGDRPVRIPRGSSSYVDIPPPVPSPYSRNSPPAAALTQPVVQPYNPPPIVTPGDRAIDAIHAYPLQKGIGNNPLNQQEFIRQRVNQ